MCESALMCSVEGTFLLYSRRLDRRRTTCTGIRGVSCSYQTSASNPRQPVLNRRYVHPSSRERSNNTSIYSLPLNQRTVETDGDKKVIYNLTNQNFIWDTSLLEYFARADSSYLLVLFTTETYTTV
jgi:hypothetical protein